MSSQLSSSEVHVKTGQVPEKLFCKIMWGSIKSSSSVQNCVSMEEVASDRHTPMPDLALTVSHGKRVLRLSGGAIPTPEQKPLLSILYQHCSNCYNLSRIIDLFAKEYKVSFVHISCHTPRYSNQGLQIRPNLSKFAEIRWDRYEIRNLRFLNLKFSKIQKKSRKMCKK
jgi:hypothetical protein